MLSRGVRERTALDLTTFAGREDVDFETKVSNVRDIVHALPAANFVDKLSSLVSVGSQENSDVRHSLLQDHLNARQDDLCIQFDLL